MRKAAEPTLNFYLFVGKSQNWCSHVCLQISSLPIPPPNLLAISALCHHSDGGLGFHRACIHLYSEDLLKADPEMKQPLRCHRPHFRNSLNVVNKDIDFIVRLHKQGPHWDIGIDAGWICNGWKNKETWKASSVCFRYVRGDPSDKSCVETNES